MEFHPSQIPIVKTFVIKNEREASIFASEMVRLGFENQKGGYKVLMPKQKDLAKRIGFIVTTEINYMLRQAKQERNLRYWTYHHDAENYAIVLISSRVLDELNL
ncbi:hypothetical protein [Candidatus Nitrosotenuis sp. DW1]|uniref:hypothetical protein n=1 Tax=Candidatus Nitrosotenuis sp. DW1 TaxID=2259672 RepID=UPI0015C9B24C|nr:hypothetical protein [Candidatus Nitrosotenuis sp. DW1]QLH08504.1 hypothetical protein DSQ19_02520 [Candidatus Nitrosotenuis sp. DW1]